MVLYRGLPSTVAGGARFSAEILGRIWRFAAGMAGISVAGMLFAQLDLWVLVGMSNLESLGYYSVQLAFGWMRHALLLVTVLIAAFLPGLIALIMHFGPVGAAFAWLGLNTAYFLIGAPLTHRRFTPGQGVQWLTGSVLPGFLAGAAVVLGGWAIMPGEARQRARHAVPAGAGGARGTGCVPGRR